MAKQVINNNDELFIKMTVLLESMEDIPKEDYKFLQNYHIKTVKEALGLITPSDYVAESLRKRKEAA